MQAVANIAWACATLRHSAPNLLNAIDARADWLVEEGTPQAVANTAVAFFKLGRNAPNLMAAIEERAGRLVEQGSPQAVANTAWACSRHQVSPNSTIPAI